MMRMSETYLIAAEAGLYLNGGANATGYINKVKTRAGAKPMNSTPTARDIMDERGRELCGEYCRFYDLKRTGMLKDNTFLNETRPDPGRHFKPESALRPIPSDFTSVIKNGAEHQNPGYQSGETLTGQLKGIYRDSSPCGRMGNESFSAPAYL